MSEVRQHHRHLRLYFCAPYTPLRRNGVVIIIVVVVEIVSILSPKNPFGAPVSDTSATAPARHSFELNDAFALPPRVTFGSLALGWSTTGGDGGALVVQRWFASLRERC